MYKFKQVIAILFFILTPMHLLAAGQWYQGGNLHKSTPNEWKSASFSNKLATSADWALTRPAIVKAVRKSGDIDNAKIYANQLLTCIDKALDGVNIGGNTSEIAASCMILMGWE